MLNKLQSIALVLAILVASSLCLSIVSAQSVSPSPTPDYTTIPTATPSPTPSPSPEPTNNTNAVDENNSTYVDIDPTYIQSINPAGVPLQLSAYNQTTVSLIFASAVACGVNASGGHWTATQDSAGQIVFYPDELGVYEIHFQVIYNREVNQSLTLVVYSGDGQAQVLNLASVNSGFTLDLLLVISDLPEIPTADEIAQAQNSLDRQLIAENNERQQQIMEENTAWSKSAIVVAVIGVVVLSVILFLNDRHRRHQDTQIQNLNRHGFDGRGHA